jgi:trans-aconitate methyltransferase
MNKSIAYQTDKLARYFTHHRVHWSQFYESERNIINQLELGATDSILDIGCGCGGLGLALNDEFGSQKYTGVEINPLAAEKADFLNPKATIFCGDFLDLRENILLDKYFNVVFSLSCFDWNIKFSEMLSAAWNHVQPGGNLVVTFRLTTDLGCDDMKQSYQYINFDGKMEGECASYVVLNGAELMHKIIDLNPTEIVAVGYYGRPSVTAVTPYKTLCFCAFSIRKRKYDDHAPVRLDLNLPKDMYASLELVY